MGSAIEVVDHEQDDIDLRWLMAGRLLRQHDPLEFARIHELVWGFVGLHSDEMESREAHEARCAFISGRSGGAA